MLLVGQAADAGDAVAVGVPAAEHLAVAVLHGDARAGHRLASVERRHPHQRILARPLEVHGQIGDQRAGRDVHRLVLVEQRGAEARAGELDEIEAGRLERDADDLEGLRAVGLRQRERADRVTVRAA